MSEKLMLGVARSIITPTVGTALYGYKPDLFSESINDDLTATAYAFSQGETNAMLITVTVGSVRTTLDTEIQLTKNQSQEYLRHSPELYRQLWFH